MQINKKHKEGRTLCCGDIHGAYKPFKHVLEKSNFDYEKDKLIFLGDVCDGWSETKEVIDELLKIKNLVYLLGNHDEWLLDYAIEKDYMKQKEFYINWQLQGGLSTLQSLGKDVDEKYINFLKSGLMYYVIEDEGLPIIFSHGNIPNNMYNMDKLVEKGESEYFIWDRSLITEAARKRHTWKWVDKRFKEIYLGHTSVEFLMKEKEHQFKPQKMTNIYAMDTGAGFDGKVSLMDISTKILYQSDFVYNYYPDERGRNR